MNNDIFDLKITFTCGSNISNRSAMHFRRRIKEER